MFCWYNFIAGPTSYFFLLFIYFYIKHLCQLLAFTKLFGHICYFPLYSPIKTLLRKEPVSDSTHRQQVAVSVSNACVWFPNAEEGEEEGIRNPEVKHRDKKNCREIFSVGVGARNV